MPHLDPDTIRLTRRRDLLLTMVMVCIGLTPAWLTPIWFARPWLLASVCLGVPAIYYSWRFAPWVPTPSEELPRVLAALQLKPEQSFCDLGAGDGRMVLRVQQSTGARCVGIEVSPLQYVVAKVRFAVQGNSKTSLVFGDLHNVDVSKFDVLYVWGTAYWVSTPHFSAHLKKALRPGARLVSYHYPLVDWEPESVDTAGLRPIYVYRSVG